MIDEYHVLTAGHCVHEGNGGDWADAITFSAGQDGEQIGTSFQRSENQPYGQANAVWYRTYNAWINSGDYAFDLAVLTLDRNLGTHVGWFAYGWNSDDTYYSNNTANTAGYPGDLTPTEFDLWYESGNARNYGITTNELRTTDIDTAGGQSGSSVYYFDGPDRVAHGVVSYFTYNDTNSNNMFDPGETPIYNGFNRITEAKFNDIGSWLTEDDTVRPPTDRPELADYDRWFDANTASATSTQLSVGDTLQASNVIRNLGTANAGSYTVTYRLSTDTDYDPGDTLVGDVVISGTNAFNNVTSNLSATVPSVAPGNYYLVWTIDSLNDVIEYSGADHEGYLQQQLSISPFDFNDQISEADPVEFGKSVIGYTMDPQGDVDMFEVFANAGDRLLIDVDTDDSLDSVLRLFDSSGTELTVSDDDFGPLPEPDIWRRLSISRLRHRVSITLVFHLLTTSVTTQSPGLGTIQRRTQVRTRCM